MHKRIVGSAGSETRTNKIDPQTDITIKEVIAMRHRLLPFLALLTLPAVAWTQSPLDDLTAADLAEGEAVGVDSTPSIYVNDRRYIFPPEQLGAYVQEELDQ